MGQGFFFSSINATISSLQSIDSLSHGIPWFGFTAIKNVITIDQISAFLRPHSSIILSYTNTFSPPLSLLARDGTRCLSMAYLNCSKTVSLRLFRPHLSKTISLQKPSLSYLPQVQNRIFLNITFCSTSTTGRNSLGRGFGHSDSLTSIMSFSLQDVTFDDHQWSAKFVHKFIHTCKCFLVWINP